MLHFPFLRFCFSRLGLCVENVLSLVGLYMCVCVCLANTQVSFPHICPSTSVHACVCVCAREQKSRTGHSCPYFVLHLFLSVCACPCPRTLSHYIIRSNASPSRSLAHWFTKTLVGCVTIWKWAKHTHTDVCARAWNRTTVGTCTGTWTSEHVRRNPQHAQVPSYTKRFGYGRCQESTSNSVHWWKWLPSRRHMILGRNNETYYELLRARTSARTGMGRFSVSVSLDNGPIVMCTRAIPFIGGLF